MGPPGRHVRRLVEKPEPLPFIADLAQVFRINQQLVHPSRLIGRVTRQRDRGAPLAKGEGPHGQDQGQQRLSHSVPGILPPPYESNRDRPGRAFRRACPTRRASTGSTAATRVRHARKGDAAAHQDTRTGDPNPPTKSERLRPRLSSLPSHPHPARAWNRSPPVRCHLHRHLGRFPIAEVSTNPSVARVLPFLCPA